MASITAIVNRGQRMRCTVSKKVVTKRAGGTPIHSADRIAATRMPVPVADSQLNLNTAGSALPVFSTTGTSRNTLLCRCGTSTASNVLLSRDFLTCGKPHTNTHTLNNTHGTQAEMTW